MPPKRASTSEAPAMTQAAIRKLVADSVTGSRSSSLQQWQVLPLSWWNAYAPYGNRAKPIKSPGTELKRLSDESSIVPRTENQKDGRRTLQSDLKK
ncbi:hypothetical protein Tco_0608333 [Tanacetum coccineum]